MSFLTSIAVLTGVYLLVGRLERLPALRFRELSSPRRYLATDVAWYGVAIAATAVSVFVFRPVLANLAIAPVRDAVDRRCRSWSSCSSGSCCSTSCRSSSTGASTATTALWNIHKVHHSTLELDGFATTRTHMIENMLRFVPSQALLFLIGMPVSVVAATVAIAAIYGVSNHSNLGIDLRWVEAVLVTPRLHRRHHVPSTTQTNYGGILTIWDRLAGTLVRADTSRRRALRRPRRDRHLSPALRGRLPSTVQATGEGQVGDTAR